MNHRDLLIPGRDYIGVGVGAVLVKQGAVLLLRRVKDPEAGCWGIQGGAVEYGETIADAVRREVREELAIEVAILALLGVTDHILPHEGTHWVSPVFSVRPLSGIARNAEPHKHSELRWFPLDQLPDNMSLPTRNALRLLRNGRADAPRSRGRVARSERDAGRRELLGASAAHPGAHFDPPRAR
jgi:ADP-ribose pyrophosphatase